MTTKKLNPKYAKSRANHKTVRARLKREGLCVWRCGHKAMKKPEGGCYILCRECRAKSKEQKRKAAAA